MVEKSQRMKPVVKVADQRERKAAQDFGDARQAASRQETRLAELRAYRLEYLGRFEAQGRDGLNGAQIREYQRFIEQLDRAIAQQEQAVQTAVSAAQGSKQSWLEKNIKANAVRNVVDRFRQAESLRSSRAEQKESDARRPVKAPSESG